MYDTTPTASPRAVRTGPPESPGASALVSSIVSSAKSARPARTPRRVTRPARAAKKSPRELPIATTAVPGVGSVLASGMNGTSSSTRACMTARSM
jgi:hypothetical protein